MQRLAGTQVRVFSPGKANRCAFLHCRFRNLLPCMLFILEIYFWNIHKCLGNVWPSSGSDICLVMPFKIFAFILAELEISVPSPDPICHCGQYLSISMTFSCLAVKILKSTEPVRSYTSRLCDTLGFVTKSLMKDKIWAGVRTGRLLFANIQ